MTNRLQQILNAAVQLILGTCKFDRGLSFLLHNDLHWLNVPEHVNCKLCIAAWRRKLQGTWSTVAYQCQKSLAVGNYAQPVDTNLLCHCVTRWARSGTFGPFQSQIQLRGTLYQIVSMIQHWVLTVLGNYLKLKIICKLLNTLSTVEMLHNSVPHKFMIDNDTDIFGLSWHKTIRVSTFVPANHICLHGMHTPSI